ncbi:MAG: hypothetical protein COW71_05750 [Ignavibacteriales bacterium CG18_big_fil_WC_8_21_14_2_50_31_20]|nr:MAG: hypothetical protein COW71_05750 [Ignavibacteriales bacterium CG18_big_fil_WC_8_21_14_2_50_31_20]
MIDLNRQNIPYFTFYSTPIAGNAINAILNIVDEGGIYYLKLVKNNFATFIIKKGSKLFNYKSPLEDLNNITDEVIDESLIHTIESIEYLTRDDYDYFAKNDGILVIFEQLVKFIPINYDGFCEIEISEDKSIATANIYPAALGGKQLNEEDVVKQIRRNNISVALNITEIKNALQSVIRTNIAYKQVLVAKGKPPVLGKEAWVEYLFNTEKKVGPLIDENGHTDFHNITSLESVTKNQTIAIYHPMVAAVDGFNVLGEKVPAPILKDIRPPVGQNYYYSETEPTYILSKIDGYVTLTAGNIVITNLYNIRGDVDFHTGHITTKGSLYVLGNVKSGFNLSMSENIKIAGYVKDSNIYSCGTVFIGGGFSGTGEGKIVAGGDVTVRYIRNQTIYTRGSVFVHKEVVESKIFAKKDIKSQSNDMFIIGGSVMAGGDIMVNQLGHEYGMKTMIEAGYDYEILAKINKVNEELEEKKKELNLLKSQIELNLSNGNMRSQKLAKTILITYQMQKNIYDELLVSQNELKSKITNPSKSKIIISGKIYPGVEIKINAHHLEIKEVMSSKIFSVSPDEEGIIINNK